MKYTIFYDSHCPICVREMELMRERCPNGHLQAVAIDAHLPQLAALSISREAAMTYIHAVDEHGQVLVGMDVIRLMYRESGLRFQAAILSLPIIKPVSHWLYPVFARNRYRISARFLPKPRCGNGRCGLPPSKR